MLRYLIPLGIFLLLVVFLAIGLSRDPNELPSVLINKPAPAFRLPQLKEPTKTFSAEEMRGKVWLLNVWASWCIACREEHQFLLDYAKSGVVPIYGLNYKDKTRGRARMARRVRRSLRAERGRSDGRVAIDYGVYGAPETYLIDQNGTIRFKQVGPLAPEIWEEKVLPLVQELNRQGNK